MNDTTFSILEPYCYECDKSVCQLKKNFNMYHYKPSKTDLACDNAWEKTNEPFRTFVVEIKT